MTFLPLKPQEWHIYFIFPVLELLMYVGSHVYVCIKFRYFLVILSHVDLDQMKEPWGGKYLPLPHWKAEEFRSAEGCSGVHWGPERSLWLVAGNVRKNSLG